MKLQTIQTFVFNKAEYRVENEEGSALLKVDYQHNMFEIEKLSEFISQSLKQELTEVAEDLLKRKHGVNFAEKK